MNDAFIRGDPIGYESEDSNNMLKPREDTLGRLRKENFSLKMRINLLEEFVRSFSEDKASCNEIGLEKKIIDLKIELMNSKRDLIEKQKLLAEAATAIDLVEKSYAEKLAAMTQLLKENTANEAPSLFPPSDGSQRIRSEKGVSTLNQGDSQSRRSVRKSRESKSKCKSTRTLSELLMDTAWPESSTLSTSTSLASKLPSEETADLMENHLLMKNEHAKGCVAVSRLVSCVKGMAAENISLKQEANNAKMLYLHESRMKLAGDGDPGTNGEDEVQTRNSIKAQENEFWWSVITELVTRTTFPVRNPDFD